MDIISGWRCRRSGIVRNFCPVSSAKVWRWWVTMHSRWEISYRRRFASRSGLRRNRAELAQALQCLADTLKSSTRTEQIV
jgi:hypothetical protein